MSTENAPFDPEQMLSDPNLVLNIHHSRNLVNVSPIIVYRSEGSSDSAVVVILCAPVAMHVDPFARKNAMVTFIMFIMFPVFRISRPPAVNLISFQATLILISKFMHIPMTKFHLLVLINLIEV